jgi:hypothetical protein
MKLIRMKGAQIRLHTGIPAAVTARYRKTTRMNPFHKFHLLEIIPNCVSGQSRAT